MSRWLFLTLFFLASTAFSAIERVTYFVNDANGSPLLEVNDAGLVIAEAEYRPYGESQDAVRRTGREATIGYADSLNQQDGIQAMGVRLYAPELGRFVSPDPVGYLDKGTVHFGRYHYANNNPYKYVDRNGEAADIVLDIGFIAYSAYTLAKEPSWTNGLALGADVVGAIVPFATGLGAAVRGGTHGVVASSKAPVIIGENMDRVNSYAGRVGGDTIDGWLAGRKWSEELNDEFIATMKSQNRTIMDIGPDFNRRLLNRMIPDSDFGRPPSLIYGGERQSLLGYGGYQQLYERSGRYEGGVPGFDYWFGGNR